MLDPLEQQPQGRDRAERVGMWISGVGHTVLVLWAIIGGALFAADSSPPPEMTDVTTISNQQFQEMAARSRGAGPVGQADGNAPEQPQTPGDTSAPEGPEVALEAPEPDTTAAALPEPSATAEPAPDLSDLETQRPPVDVATLAPVPQVPPAEAAPETPAPETPVAEAAPDTATPARPDQPVTPSSALALDRSLPPPDRPDDLREAVAAAREAAAAEQQRQAAAQQAEEDQQAALAAREAAEAEQEQRARAAAERAEQDRQEAAAEERAAEQRAAKAEQAEAERAEAERVAEAEREAEERRAAEARLREEEEAERRAEEARLAEEQRRAEEAREAQIREAAEARQREEERLAEEARRAAEEEQQRLAREAEQRRLEEARAAADAELARQTALAEQLAEQQRLQDAALDAQEATPSPVDGNAPEGEAEGGGSDVLTDALNEAGSAPIQDNDLDNALADALGETRPSELPPRESVDIASVPMTQSEKDGFRDAVQSCWNLGTVSTEALETRVVVGFAMDRNGRPDPDSFRVVGDPEPDAARQQAFEAARRAVMRCAGSGYILPSDKYNEWDDVEMTFTPSGVEGFE